MLAISGLRSANNPPRPPSPRLIAASQRVIKSSAASLKLVPTFSKLVKEFPGPASRGLRIEIVTFHGPVRSLPAVNQPSRIVHTLSPFHLQSSPLRFTEHPRYPFQRPTSSCDPSGKKATYFRGKNCACDDRTSDKTSADKGERNFTESAAGYTTGPLFSCVPQEERPAPERGDRPCEMHTARSIGPSFALPKRKHHVSKRFETLRFVQQRRPLRIDRFDDEFSDLGFREILPAFLFHPGRIKSHCTGI